MLTSEQILGLIFFFVVVIFAIPWSIFTYKRMYKIVNLLMTKYKNVYKINLMSWPFLHLKLFFGYKRLPKEIRDIYYPFWIMGIAGYIVGGIFILALIVYFIIVL